MQISPESALIGQYLMRGHWEAIGGGGRRRATLRAVVVLAAVFRRLLVTFAAILAVGQADALARLCEQGQWALADVRLQDARTLRLALLATLGSSFVSIFISALLERFHSTC